VTSVSALRQFGQIAAAPAPSALDRRVPQCGQNAASSKRRAKQTGQLTVVSLASQYGQRPASAPTAAPQFGQWSDAASMVRRICEG
jgi:hypothetical protein